MPVGTNAATFNTPALTETTSCWVQVSNIAGSVESAAATVQVFTPPGITAEPASVSITSGQTTTLEVTATGTAPLTYEWFEGSVGTTTTPVGTNSASFTTPALTATTTYWVRVSNAGGTVDSAAATVTVTDVPLPNPDEFALIPAGEFEMGDNFAEGSTDERPVHTVNLSAFYMEKYEMTKELWDSVQAWGAAYSR